MLLGILRMPIEADDGVVAFTQFRSAARSAADRIEQLTAERDRLREALNQSRLAFAGHVSVQSAIDMIDCAALDPNRLREGVQP